MKKQKVRLRMTIYELKKFTNEIAQLRAKKMLGLRMEKFAQN